MNFRLGLLAIVIVVMCCGGCGKQIVQTPPTPSASPATQACYVFVAAQGSRKTDCRKAVIMKPGEIWLNDAKALDIQKPAGVIVKTDADGVTRFYIVWKWDPQTKVLYTDTDGHAIEILGNGFGNAMARAWRGEWSLPVIKTAGPRATPPVGNDGPELTLYGPITGLTPIKGKKGHYKLEVDVQTDNPELVKTVVLGKTRINGLVSN